MKSKTRAFPLGLNFPVVVTGLVFGVSSCAGSDTPAPDSMASTSVSTTAPVVPSPSGTPTTMTSTAPSTAVTTTAATSGTTSAESTSTTTTAPETSNTATTSATSETSTTNPTSTDVSSAEVTSSEVAGETSEAVTEEPAADDIDMTAEDFSCIGDWDKVLGFRITNLLGHLDEALAVANSTTGGVYPVGTLIQHLPTEAMVKRKAGFSPETKDWEFFVLTLGQDGTTTIKERGTTEIQTSMGQTCASCHTMVTNEWDFICNTWAEHAGGNCGFDFGDAQLEQQLASDTRCK